MPDLNWYINRLKAMSAPEVSYRLYQQAMCFVENKRFIQARKVRSITKYKISSVLLNERIRDIFLWKSEVDFYKSQYDEAENTLVHNQIKSTTFPVFELGIDLAKPDVKWHLDPKTKKFWPLINSSSIDIRDTQNISEVDYVWRVNRCQHLIDFARMSYIHDDSQLKELVVQQIDDWINANPYCMGVNWTSAMEMSIRCISWVIALSYLVQENNLPDDITQRICDSISLQMDYVYHHLSRYSSANNHLIVELTGLFTIGLLFKKENQEQKWLQRGLNAIEIEVQRQIYPDGVNKEQSTHYHSLVLDCLLWIIVLAQREGIDLPEIIYKRAEAMCEYIAAIMDSNGNVPAFGDSDDGHVIWLMDLSKENNYRSQLVTGAVLFNRADFKSAAGHFDEKSFWLLGSRGFRFFQEIEASSKIHESQAFADSGCYVLRSGQGEREKLLLFDCGSLGYPSTAAHGHADALGIWLSIGGHPMLIDPGTYSYLLHPEWRKYFRSTAAHNTVEINGSDQSEMGGPYIWIQQAKSSCHAWHSSPSFDYVVGSHDGYYKRFGMLHTRRILFIKPDYWYVEDILENTSRIDAQTLFHFAPGELSLNTTETCHSCEYNTENTQSGITILLTNRADRKVSIKRADGSNMQGWISPKYGRKIRGSVLTIDMKPAGSYRLSYLIIPNLQSLSKDSRGSTHIDSPISLKTENGYERFVIVSEQREDEIFHIFDPRLRFQAGNLEINAKTICVRSNRQGIVEAIFILVPSAIRWEGNEVNSPCLKKSYAEVQSSGNEIPTLNLQPLGIDQHIQKPRRSDIAITLR